MRSHDFREDFSHDNGNYWSICGKCSTHFIGLKGRQQCKLCTEGWIKCDTAEDPDFVYETFDGQLYKRVKT